jgi:hypothetical protein
MKSAITQDFFRTCGLKYYCFTGIFVLCTQFLYSQDYDFEQTDDSHKLVVMEAENFTTNTPNGDVTWTLTDSPPDFSGQGAMMAVTSSPFTTADAVLAGSAVLTYKIKFIRSGQLYIWARASRTGGGDDSYHAGIDGVITDSSTFLTFHMTDFDYGTWGWIYYRATAGQASVNIPSVGVHDLNIYIRENGFRIDKILLTDDPSTSYTPEGMGPDETLALSAIPTVTSDNDVFSVYPNPAGHFINIEAKDNKYTDAIVTIIDLQGRPLKAIVLDGNHKQIADVSGFEPGMYILKFQQNNQCIAVSRFFKN